MFGKARRIEHPMRSENRRRKTALREALVSRACPKREGLKTMKTLKNAIVIALGAAVAIALISAGDGIRAKAQDIVGSLLWDTNAFVRERSTAIATYPTSQTLTGVSLVGAAIGEKGSRWSVVSNPAAGSQASASIAAESGVRHVADCVSFSAGSTTAPVLTALKVNLRDGATGAGTVIRTWQLIIPAATGQNVAPFELCGLNLAGTTNTAMTIEFSASLANLIEAVSLSGFNVQ
jgi:hypothetical protein